jgi:hypothetical protein
MHTSSLLYKNTVMKCAGNMASNQVPSGDETVGQGKSSVSVDLVPGDDDSIDLALLQQDPFLPGNNQVLPRTYPSQSRNHRTTNRKDNAIHELPDGSEGNVARGDGQLSVALGSFLSTGLALRALLVWVTVLTSP